VNQDLTEQEHELAHHMPEIGGAEAQSFLSQLNIAQVTQLSCACGCASIMFQLKDQPEPANSVHVLGDFVFGETGAEAGVFIYSSEGILKGIQVYVMAGDAPKRLPFQHQLRNFVKDNPQAAGGNMRYCQRVESAGRK
jgi:hypothetical protein